MNNPKLQAIQLLQQVLAGKSLSALLQQQEALVKEYCFGCCRWHPQLEGLAQQLLKKPLKKKDQDIYQLLLVGLYQLMHLRTPKHAAINDTVSLTKQLNKPWASKLINACLRRFLREQDTLITALGEPGQYAHPNWMITKLKHAWPNDWQQLLAANNTRAPMTLRVNPNKITAQAYLTEALNQQGTLPAGTPTAVQLNHPINALELPGFHEAQVSVQDEASQHVAPLFNLSPGARLLDACSAPGGKTCHLLERFPGIALTAIDIDPERLQKVQQNLDRLQLNATLITADCAALETWWDNTPFDALLIDAPCSATGVIRRHPDIKLLRRESDLATLAELQLSILKTLWTTLKPGGQCVYTTCSIFPEENDHVIQAFLAKHADAELQAINLPIGNTTSHGWQCLPQAGGHDGFYYCCLKKALAR